MIRIAIVILLFQSCSPAQRLGRLVKNNPELATTTTVYKSDTTIIERVSADSTFILTRLTDTFYVENDRLKIKVVREYDTLKVFGECLTDTIIKQIAVEQTDINPVLIKNGKMMDVLLMIAAILCLLIFLFFLLKRR